MEDEKLEMNLSPHRSLIKMQSLKDSFEEINTKITEDPETFDRNALHEAIKELSSSLDEVEKLGYSQISAIIPQISKCEILVLSKNETEEKVLNSALLELCAQLGQYGGQVIVAMMSHRVYLVPVQRVIQ